MPLHVSDIYMSIFRSDYMLYHLRFELNIIWFRGEGRPHKTTLDQCNYCPSGILTPPKV